VFDASLRENVDVHGVCSYQEVLAAVRKTGLEGLWQRCGGRVDARIGKGGVKVSQSERKLIVL